jgi:hypothetical protein
MSEVEVIPASVWVPGCLARQATAYATARVVTQMGQMPYRLPASPPARSGGMASGDPTRSAGAWTHARQVSGSPGLATIACGANAEVEIVAELVQDLLRDQHPDLADRPVTLGARGWDNQLWRLGEDLAIRLPWATDSADALLLKENTWLPVLAPLLPLPVPVPQHLGEPSRRFPRPWIVTTWVPGVPADLAPATSSSSAADGLAAFLTALHRPAPTGAPKGRGRGGALSEVAEGVAGSLTAAIELGLIPNPDEVQVIWHDAVAAPAGGPYGAPSAASSSQRRADAAARAGRPPGVRPPSPPRRLTAEVA